MAHSAHQTAAARIGINLLTFNTQQLTGVGNFFKQLIENLPALQSCEFVFICQRGFDLESVFDLTQVIRYSRINCPKLKSPLRRVFYEQIVLPFRCGGLDALFSPCAANPIVHWRLRTITTIHDLTPFFVTAKYGWVQGFYVRWITRLLARHSNAIITVSEHSKSDIMRLLDTPSSKVHVVYNSVNLRNSCEVRYENFFLCVGTQQPGKNLEGVIRSFIHFAQSLDTESHKLVIVGGRGWGRDACKTLSAQSGLGDRILFTGYISQAELDGLYASCKGLILLSHYEGFGLPALEALNWKKPAVVSNVSALAEVVGETGILVSPTDYVEAAVAMKSIADNPKKYLVGREKQLQKFSTPSQVSKFLSALGVQIDQIDRDHISGVRLQADS